MSVFFTGQALQNAGTGTRKRRIKLKPFFSMHVVIYTVAVAVKINPPPPPKKKKPKKHANKYTGKIHDVQISIVQQRISKTKNYGGKGGRGGGGKKKEKKSKCFPGEIAGLAAQKLISNITFGFTVIFTFIHSKCSMQASNFSGGWGGGRGGGEGKRAQAMEGEAKKEDGQGEGGWGGEEPNTHARTHARTPPPPPTRTHTHTHTIGVGTKGREKADSFGLQHRKGSSYDNQRTNLKARSFKRCIKYSSKYKIESYKTNFAYLIIRNSAL